MGEYQFKGKGQLLTANVHEFQVLSGGGQVQWTANSTPAFIFLGAERRGRLGGGGRHSSAAAKETEFGGFKQERGPR